MTHFQLVVGLAGRSTGARITFTESRSGKPVSVFTTRPETIYGVTFVAISPDSEELLQELTEGNVPAQAILANYRDHLKKLEEDGRNLSIVDLDDMERGVKLPRVELDHPLKAGVKLPVFVASYVNGEYG